MCFPAQEVKLAIKKMNFADEAKKIIEFKDIEIKNLEDIIKQKDNIISLTEQKNNNLDGIILEKNNHILILQKSNEKLERRFRLHKVVSTVVISGLAVTSGYLILRK